MVGLNTPKRKYANEKRPGKCRSVLVQVYLHYVILIHAWSYGWDYGPGDFPSMLIIPQQPWHVKTIFVPHNFGATQQGTCY